MASRFVARTALAFFRNEAWTNDTLDGALAVLFGDVTGDRMADVIAVKADGAYMRRSNRWFFGGVEQLSQLAFSPSPSIQGPIFTLADLTGDGRADLIQVNDDAIWASVATDRRIPIRFVQLVAEASMALPVKAFNDAVAKANAVYRAAGIQFFIQSVDSVGSAALHDLTGSGSAPAADLAAAKDLFNPACEIGSDVGGLPTLLQLQLVATRCAAAGEILVYVARVGSSTAQLPWEGKAFFMDPGLSTRTGRCASTGSRARALPRSSPRVRLLH